VTEGKDVDLGTIGLRDRRPGSVEHATGDRPTHRCGRVITDRRW